MKMGEPWDKGEGNVTPMSSSLENQGNDMRLSPAKFQLQNMQVSHRPSMPMASGGTDRRLTSENNVEE